MGWMVVNTALGESPRALRERLENELVESQERAGNKVIQVSTRGTRSWMLLQTPHGDKWIGLILWDMSGSTVGYKLLDESMHPLYYDCPLGFLKKAEVQSEEWRIKVQEQANQRQRRRRLKPGQRIVLKEGCEIDGGGRTLKFAGRRKVGKRSVICGETDTGVLYQVPPSMILTTLT